MLTHITVMNLFYLNALRIHYLTLYLPGLVLLTVNLTTTTASAIPDKIDSIQPRAYNFLDDLYRNWWKIDKAYPLEVGQADSLSLVPGTQITAIAEYFEEGILFGYFINQEPSLVILGATTLGFFIIQVPWHIIFGIQTETEESGDYSFIALSFGLFGNIEPSVNWALAKLQTRSSTTLQVLDCVIQTKSEAGSIVYPETVDYIKRMLANEIETALGQTFSADQIQVKTSDHLGENKHGVEATQIDGILWRGTLSGQGKYDIYVGTESIHDPVASGLLT